MVVVDAAVVVAAAAVAAVFAAVFAADVNDNDDPTKLGTI